MARLIQDPEVESYLADAGTWADIGTDAEQFIRIHDAIRAIKRLDPDRANVVYVIEEGPRGSEFPH